jgi:hypothetical protein
MMDKIAYKGIAIALLLILSIFIPYVESTSIAYRSQPIPVALSLTQHKITETELQAIKIGQGTYQTNENYNQKINGHGTGLSPSNYDSALVQNVQVIDNVQYLGTSSAVDNSATPWFPPIGNQDGQGSCAAWAVGYYVKTYQEAKEHSWNLSAATWDGGYYGHPSLNYQNKIMSPTFLYNLINYGVDDGSNFEEAIDLINNVGLCTWQKMPYTPTDPSSWPSEAAWTEAAQYRGNGTYGYKYIYANTDQGITNLKNWLAAGNLAVIAVDANQYDYLSSTDFWTTDNYATVELNHANTIVGYDDTITYTEGGVTHTGAFKLANSWGLGSWEHVADGFLWISYNAMKQLCTVSNPAVVFEDLSGYQPQILASFRINHSVRGDCQISFGLGTVNAPIVTKSFSETVLEGAFPFCSNNIILDLTEFKSNMSTFYNQPFFMSVFDKRYAGGTASTGTIMFFGIGTTNSTQTPMATVNNAYVNLAITTSICQPTLDLSSTSGPAGGTIEIKGAGFAAGNSVNISYLNPVNFSWIPVVINYELSQENFTYGLSAPDLKQSNIIGDHSPLSDTMVFQVKDDIGNTINSTVPYIEYRRGLVQIATSQATGLYGNNTDLSGEVFVQNSQTIPVRGKWFNPGFVTLLWDGVIDLGRPIADATGAFTADIQVPLTSAGTHILTAKDSSNFCINITRIPNIADNTTDNWQTGQVIINLTPDTPIEEIYYKINNGLTQNVTANGQPKIILEGENTIEYWGTWNFGSETIQLPHKAVTVNIDKTAPNGTISTQTIATSPTVTLSLTATDAVSGIAQMRFSNDGITFSDWEPFSNTKVWSLTGGDGQKTVYVQYSDTAGFISGLYSCIVTLNSVQPTSTVNSTATPTSIAKPTITPTPIPTSTIVPTLSPSATPTTSPMLPSSTMQVSGASLVPQVLEVIAVVGIIAIVAAIVALAKKKKK